MEEGLAVGRPRHGARRGGVVDEVARVDERVAEREETGVAAAAAAVRRRRRRSSSTGSRSRHDRRRRGRQEERGGEQRQHQQRLRHPAPASKLLLACCCARSGRSALSARLGEGCIYLLVWCRCLLWLWRWRARLGWDGDAATGPGRRRHGTIGARVCMAHDRLSWCQAGALRTIDCRIASRRRIRSKNRAEACTKQSQPDRQGQVAARE